MELHIINEIASQLKVSSKQIEATLGILQEGGTVPFIAR
jgi:transcriptional accessory protein Tex/SPT6